MSKFKWALILPAVHVTIAAAVFQWDYRRFPPFGAELWRSAPRRILRGLDAPANLLGVVKATGWMPRCVLGFDSDDW